jgi:hypothetical protein
MTLRRRLLLALVGAFLAFSLTTPVIPARLSGAQGQALGPIAPVAPMLPPEFPATAGFSSTPYPAALG